MKKIAKLIESLIMNKRKAELRHWTKKYSEEKNAFSNDHYEYFFTKHFNFENDAYTEKKILDIGCGPRGSLEWADNALVRIGLDPLVNDYAKFGISDYKMTFIASNAEKIPFSDDYFDFITSFNSLDHVDDLDLTINQIKLKLKPGGHFLLLTEVNHNPTPTEPIEFGWDIVFKFYPEFKLLDEMHYEKTDGLYQSILSGPNYNHNNTKKRSGILSAKFIKL